MRLVPAWRGRRIPVVQLPASSLIVVAVGLLLASSARAEGIFSDGFESGDGSAWTSTFPRTTYSSEGCLSGQFCGKQTLIQKCDQGAFWKKNIRFSGDDIYAKAHWRFPIGYSFSKSSVCVQSTDLKALFFETESNTHRCFVNFRQGSGDRADIAFICGEAPGGFVYGTGAKIVADGKWHSIQVHMSRKSGQGRVQIWHDGRKFIDQDYPFCSGPCPRINAVKVGAYSNYSPIKTQSFFVDDVSVATNRILGSPMIPVSQQPAPPRLLGIK